MGWMERTSRAFAASRTFGKDAGLRRSTGAASAMDGAPKPSIRTGAARAAIAGPARPRGGAETKSVV